MQHRRDVHGEHAECFTTARRDENDLTNVAHGFEAIGDDVIGGGISQLRQERRERRDVVEPRVANRQSAFSGFHLGKHLSIENRSSGSIRWSERERDTASSVALDERWVDALAYGMTRLNVRLPH